MKKFFRIVLIVLSVMLAVLLAVTTLSSSLISCVRAHFTPEYVYNFMNSIDYASLELPDGSGNTASLCDIVNDQVRDFGIYFTEDDLNGLIRTFSLDAVITSYMQDVRSWALDDGPVPMLDSGEVAETILMGLDQSLYMFLGLFGDPEQLLADAISGMISAADFSEAFARGDTIQKVLAVDTMIFIISISAALFLLILIAQRLRLVPTAVFTGLACITSGSVMLFARQILAPYKAQLFASGSADMLPEAVIDMVYLPFLETVHRTGTFISLGGLAVLIVFSVVGTFAAMIRREKDKARRFAEQKNSFGTPYASFAYNAPDYMAQNFASEQADRTNDGISPEKSEADAENHNDTDY